MKSMRIISHDDRSQFTFTHFTLDKYRDELNHLFSYLLENNFVFHYNLAYTDQQSNEFNINEFWNSLDMKLISSNITFRYIG